MSIFKGIIIAAALTASTAAMASPAQLTDTQYLAAVRCSALTASPALGKADTSAIDAVVKAEGRSRFGPVYDRADEVRSDAAREASRATGDRKTSLIAERDGACQVFAARGATMVAGSGSGAGR